MKIWYTHNKEKSECGMVIMIKLRYTFKSDILFKMVFVKYPELLKNLVAAMLGILVESITDFEIMNPEMTPESIEKKFCRLDINMRVNGQRVDLEIQVTDEKDYPERVMFYWARDYSSSLPAGEDYSKLPRTIIISILDFKLFDCEEYHSFFQPLETTRHTLLSDKMGFHFFELPKLPKDICEDNILLLWLSLFNADTEEELEKLSKLEVPVMSEAINAYYSVSNSSEYYEMERLREKTGHDEAQALHTAKQEGKEEKAVEIARNLMDVGMSIRQIMEVTGLTQDEVEKIYNAIYLS